MGAVDMVELEVRELVRRRGIDPFADQLQVRRLVDEVVADYDERSLTSALPQLVNVGQAARSVYDAVAGFGPLQRHLDDPTVEEVWTNERLPGGRHCLDVLRRPRACASCCRRVPIPPWPASFDLTVEPRDRRSGG